MSLKIATAAAAMTVLGAGSAHAFMLSLDTFDTDQRVVDNPGTGLVASEVAAPEALGGWRDLFVETTGPNPGVAFTTLEVINGTLGFSNVNQATGRGFITYDGNDGDATTVNTTGLGGVNFLFGTNSNPGNTLLDFDVVTFESDLEVTITAWDMGGEVAEFFEILPPAGIFTPELPLADFTTLTAGTFDWTQVGALQFAVESTVVGYDGEIDQITLETIPLPAPVLLLFAGIGGLGALRARRKAA